MRTIAIVIILAVVACSCLLALRADYAPGYSRAKYLSIRVGMSRAEVVRILGDPLSIEPAEGYVYWKTAAGPPADPPMPAGGPTTPPPQPTIFRADLGGKITTVYGGTFPVVEPGEWIGHHVDEIRNRYGEMVEDHREPDRELYWYSKMKRIKGQYVAIVVINDKGLVSSCNLGRIGYYTGGEGVRNLTWLEWLEENL